MFKKPAALAAALCLAIGMMGCDKRQESSASGPKVAYVTNGIDPFWDTAVAGAKVGAQEFGLSLEVQKPAKGVQDQNRILESLIAKGTQGIAISPIDAQNQVSPIDAACASAKVITQDSDAPATKRLCFIGVNNYKAGRACGRLVKAALPNGGSVIILVGRLEQLNAQQRRQGVIDEILDRPMQDLTAVKFDPQSGEIKGDKYVILDTRTDNFNYDRAKANAEDAITANPNLGALVGLFAYNTPLILEAVKGAGKIGKVQVIGFDEQDGTLQGIVDGSCYGTVSQDPFRYGYHSMRILASLMKGDQSVLPPNAYMELDGVEVTKENVDAFWKNLKEQQAQGKAVQ